MEYHLILFWKLYKLYFGLYRFF